MKAKCVICGREFEKGSHTAKVCGPSCRAERNRETDRQYRAANPEKVRENNRRYRAANPEKHRETDRRRGADRRAANPEKIRENDRRYRAANPEKVREKNRRHKGVHRAAKLLGVHPLIYVGMKSIDRTNQSQPQPAE